VRVLEPVGDQRDDDARSEDDACSSQHGNAVPVRHRFMSERVVTSARRALSSGRAYFLGPPFLCGLALPATWSPGRCLGSCVAASAFSLCSAFGPPFGPFTLTAPVLSIGVDAVGVNGVSCWEACRSGVGSGEDALHLLYPVGEQARQSSGGHEGWQAELSRSTGAVVVGLATGLYYAMRSPLSIWAKLGVGTLAAALVGFVVHIVDRRQTRERNRLRGYREL
jgi:hypothetical protein